MKTIFAIINTLILPFAVHASLAREEDLRKELDELKDLPDEVKGRLEASGHMSDENHSGIKMKDMLDEVDILEKVLDDVQFDDNFHEKTLGDASSKVGKMDHTIDPDFTEDSNFWGGKKHFPDGWTNHCPATSVDLDICLRLPASGWKDRCSQSNVKYQTGEKSYCDVQKGSTKIIPSYEKPYGGFDKSYYAQWWCRWYNNDEELVEPYRIRNICKNCYYDVDIITNSPEEYMFNDYVKLEFKNSGREMNWEFYNCAVVDLAYDNAWCKNENNNDLCSESNKDLWGNTCHGAVKKYLPSNCDFQCALKKCMKNKYCNGMTEWKNNKGVKTYKLKTIILGSTNDRRRKHKCFRVNRDEITRNFAPHEEIRYSFQPDDR